MVPFSQFLYALFCNLNPTNFHSLTTYGLLTAIVGDITPSDGVPKKEKSRREKAALKEMCEVLGGGLRGIYAYATVFFYSFGFRNTNL